LIVTGAHRIIVDTSGYVIGSSPRHPLRRAVRDILAESEQPPVVSPLVLAEIDYLVLDRTGTAGERAVLADLTSGAYEIPRIDLDDLIEAYPVIEKYHDLAIGLTDAVNVVLADRFDTDQILTTDQRHFRAITPLSRRFAAFRLLPLDR
jgi:predicted nucleic acid-binding protein